EMEPGTRMVGNSVYFDPNYMSIYAQVYTYGAAVWIVFMVIMQVLLIFATDPREVKEDKGKTESARMLLRHHETNKNSTSSRERDVENTQTATEEASRKTERTQER
ncbi:hypothetical protein PENTCL1PPCAC_6742, partial [Pristionchus entomophagus]